MPAVARALENFQPRLDEVPFLENVYRWVLDGSSSNPRAFSSAALDIVSRTADLHQAYGALGAANLRVFDALRPYLVTQLKAARCSDSIAESQTPAAFNAVLTRLKVDDDVKPIAADTVTPSRLLGAARIDAYWQTPESRQLRDELLRLHGTGRATTTEKERLTREWQLQADRLLTEVEQWTGRREAEERDYFYQKSILFAGMTDMMLPSAGRTRALRAAIEFLRHADADREYRALWFAFLQRLLDDGRGSSRRDMLAALDDSQHPVIRLYARLARIGSRQP
jgi:hypothetical protein